MAETCKLGEEVTNKMLGVGRGLKRIVKLGRERFDCWSLSWNKQSTVLFGWSEFEPKSPCWDWILYWGVSVGIDVWVDKIILDQ